MDDIHKFLFNIYNDSLGLYIKSSVAVGDYFVLARPSDTAFIFCLVDKIFGVVCE